MNYEFPRIETIDDVLPHVKDRNEFIVAEREGYTVIDYVVSKPDTWTMGRDDLPAAVRRECRGLIFDRSKRLVSRPLHKFFNVGEKDETQPHLIDLGKQHAVLHKMDGSMVRPLVVGGALYLATRKGVTDVANAAQEFLLSLPSRDATRRCRWLRSLFAEGLTPVLEYVAPTNKIIISYDEPELVLLAVRDNLTGAYHDLSQIDSPFPIVESIESTMDMKNLLSYVRDLVGLEGFVVRFSDGHMVKIKADEYVRAHKIKDVVRTDRHVLDLILAGELDDAMSVLDAADRARVQSYESWFWSVLDETANRIESLVDLARVISGGDRKRVALDFVPNLLDKRLSRFIFAALDGRSVRDELLKLAKNSVGSETRYEDFVSLLRGDRG